MRHLDTWLQARIGEVRQVTPGVRELRIECPGVTHCAPGSHINVRVLIEGRSSHRSYSVVRQEADGSLCIAVRAQRQSRGGSRYMWSLEAGSLVQITPPACDFELVLGQPHYLLVAGGIGVTPLLGMARALVARGAAVQMLYAASSRQEMAYAGELRQLLGERVRFFASDRGERLDVAAAIAALPQGAELYVCGPLGLMEAARGAWGGGGRPASGLHFETFGSSGRHASQPFVLQVPRLGLRVEVAGNQSMLDCLAAAGVEVLSDCRRGECGLCAVDILQVDGELDHRDVFFSEQQRQSGRRMCACVSRLAGGTVTIDTAWRGDPVLRG